MPLFQELKSLYRFTDDDYQSWLRLGQLSDIPDPRTRTAVFKPLVSAISEGVARQARFVIYGDYDADGLTATSILVLTLKKLGAEVGFFIPSRYREGYGLNMERLQQFKERGYDFLITVDNGISKVVEIARAKELGFTVVVLDHHEAPEVLPPADHIFQQSLSGYSDYNISAAFLALLVSEGVLGYYDDYLLTLAGIAVLSDLMPLVGANVALVRMALDNIEKKRYSPLMSLVDPKHSVDQKMINYEIVPALNAPGRLKEGLEVNDVVRLLIEENPRRIAHYAEELLKINSARKELVNAEFDPSVIDASKAVIIYHSTLPVGLGGLLANKIYSFFDKPTVVLTALEDGVRVTGSVRTPSSYDVVGAFSDLPPDLFLDCGGHQNAAGFTIRRKDEEEFILKFVEKLITSSDKKVEKTFYTPLDLADLTFENLRLIESFSPFGIAHPAPLFGLTVEVAALSGSTSSRHIIAALSPEVRVVFFSGRDKLPDFGAVTLIGQLAENDFNLSHPTIDFRVEKVKDDTLISTSSKIDA